MRQADLDEVRERAQEAEGFLEDAQRALRGEQARTQARLVCDTLRHF